VVLIVLTSFCSLMTVNLGLSILEVVPDPDPRGLHRPMLRVWKFAELTAGSGDADAIRSKLAGNLRWVIEDGGASGRMATGGMPLASLALRPARRPAASSSRASCVGR